MGFVAKRSLPYSDKGNRKANLIATDANKVKKKAASLLPKLTEAEEPNFRTSRRIPA